MIELGLGAREALRVPGTGVVLRPSGGTAWLRLPGGIVGLAAPDAPAGPLWARGTFPWKRFVAGDRVTVTAEALEVAAVPLSLAGAAIWEGPLPDSADLEAGLPLAARALARAEDPSSDAQGAQDPRRAAARRSALLDPPFAVRARRAARRVAGGDLKAAADELGGVGPGLTPAGDDALAGILLAVRARRGAGAEPDLLAVAGSVPTSDLSSAFLHWAARGQHIAPAHDLLVAAAAGDPAATAAAARSLSSFGSSSGADLAFGLRLGLVMRIVAVPGEN